MFKKARSKLALAVGTTAFVAGNAAAQAVDVTGVTSAINGSIAPIALIGAAVLLVLVAIKTYKWVRRAM